MNTEEPKQSEPPTAYREAKARVESALAESKSDDEKRKFYFGVFETTDGSL